jgi:Fe-S oxidoreductase
VDLLAVHRKIAAAELPASRRRSDAAGTSQRRPSESPVTSAATVTDARTKPARSVSFALRAVTGTVTSFLRPVADAAPQRSLLWAGCDALAAGGHLARQALAVAAALDAPLTLAPETALCCGLKLVESGHPEMFAAHAARVRIALLGSSRRPAPVHLVLLSPGCVRAMRERWPPLPDGSRVEHVTTYLSRALAAHADLRERPPLQEAVTYHDPCELARGLSELTAPRALLAAAVAELREPPRCGTDTSCCGANGLMPRTLPAVASAMADDRRGELEACGAPAVTASPACSAALGAVDVVSVLARWLGVDVEETE